MKRLIVLFSLLVIGFGFINKANAQKQMVVDINQKGIAIQTTMYGIFFEDINFAADGGIYAELIKNRSFEFKEPLMGWSEPQGPSAYFSRPEYGSIMPILLMKDVNNRRYAKITVTGTDSYLIDNEGFRGIGIKKDLDYNFSIKLAAVKGDVTITAQLLDSDKQVIGECKPMSVDGDWKYYEASITAMQTVEKGSFRLKFTGKGELNIDMVSLFPSDTWKGRKNGMRNDLVEALYDLHPGFIRFPGGCIVEGHTLDERYQWKKTIGPIEDRATIINRWNYERKEKPAPDYFQTFGLGFYEYFQLAEDLGAEPLPILNCGMSCQFNAGELVSMDELQPFVDDALDLIEFANGSADSGWGEKRAEMGHPEPFNLKYIGIGNEQWGPQYFERYKVFENQIREKYPDVKIISTSGPLASDEVPGFKLDIFGYAHETLKDLHPDLVDEHYYTQPDWLLKNADRYDSYDRNSYQIFAGEYAGQSEGMTNLNNVNNWQCALAEAAYMTGLERNADVVSMTCYAPLLKNMDAWQWTPDLIYFDNLKVLKSVSYYVQQMYSVNRGTKVIPIQIDGQVIKGQDELYATASVDTKTNELILKIVNVKESEYSTTIAVEGVKRFKSVAGLIEIYGNPDDLNTMDNPEAIVSHKSEFTVKGNVIPVKLKPLSFSVIRIKM